MEVVGYSEPGSAVWFWAAAATIIATLASTVAALYRSHIATKDTEISESKTREEALKLEVQEVRTSYREAVAKLEEEVNECRKEREALKVQMARFETRLDMLEKSDRSLAVHEGRIEKRLDDLENDAS